MRHAAATDADGALLSWLPPAVAGEQSAEAHAAASAAHVALYVRTAFDPAAGALLDEESARYASFPAYAAHFDRLGVSPADTVIDARRGATAAAGAAYRAGVDEVVLRAIVARESVDEYLRFIDGARTATA